MIKIKRRKRPINKTIIILLLPTLLYMVIFVVFPLFYSLITSFKTWILIRPDLGNAFTGFTNYIRIFQDTYFYQALSITVIFSISFVVVQFFLGLLIAVVMNNFPRIEKIFTAFFIIPTVMTPVILALQWRFMLDAEYGILNWVLRSLHLIDNNIAWLSSYPEVIFSIIMVDVWHWTPLLYIIILAGLKSIPSYIIEAAKIDGANEFQVLWRIKVPIIKNIIIIGILIRFITAMLFFDEIFILTQGGPGVETQVLSYFIFKMGFRYWDMGQATAASWIFVIMIELVVMFFLRMLSERRSEKNVLTKRV